MNPLIRFAEKSRGVILATAVLLAMAGCAGFPRRLEAPRVSLVDIQIEKVTLFETVFQIKLRLYNTNDVPLTIRGTDCRLKLQQHEVAAGVSSERVTVPALDTAVITMAVYSSVIDVLKGLLALPAEQKLEYTLTGRVHIEGGVLGPDSLGFNSQGKLSLKDLKGV